MERAERAVDWTSAVGTNQPHAIFCVRAPGRQEKNALLTHAKATLVASLALLGSAAAAMTPFPAMEVFSVTLSPREQVDFAHPSGGTGDPDGSGSVKLTVMPVERQICYDFSLRGVDTPMMDAATRRVGGTTGFSAGQALVRREVPSLAERRADRGAGRRVHAADAGRLLTPRRGGVVCQGPPCPDGGQLASPTWQPLRRPGPQPVRPRAPRRAAPAPRRPAARTPRRASSRRSSR